MSEHDDPVMAEAIAKWARTPHWPNGELAGEPPMGEWMTSDDGTITGIQFSVSMTAEQVQRAFPRQGQHEQG